MWSTRITRWVHLRVIRVWFFWTGPNTNTRKELQIVPDHENPPPDSVIRGKPDRYIPEKILRQQIRNGVLQYLVKWERYPESEATWESADKLQEDVPDMINKFLDTGKA